MMKILDSTNGQNNIILMVLFAVLAFFGVGSPETISLASILMLATEVSKGERKGKFSGNVVAYLGTALIAAVPYLSGIVTGLEPLTDFLFTGQDVSIGALFGFLIPVFNEIVFLFKNKPWKEETPPPVA